MADFIYETQPDGTIRVRDADDRSLARKAADFISDPQTAKTAGRILAEGGAGIAIGSMLGPAGAAASIPVRIAGQAVAQGAASLASELFDPSEDPFARAATTALFGAAGEGFVGAGARLLRGGFGVREGGAEAAQQILDRGGRVDVSRFSSSRPVQALSGMASGSVGGSARLEAAREFGERVHTEIADDFVQSFGRLKNPEAVGKLVQDAIEGGSEAFKATARENYKLVSELAGGATVDLAPFLSRLETAATKRMGGGSARELLADVKRIIGDDVTAVSFGQAQDIRTAVLRLRKPDELISGTTSALGKELAPILTKSMEDAAGALSGDALQAWRIARAHYEAGAKDFGDKLVTALVKKNPSAVVKSIGKAPEDIRRIRRIVGDEAFDEVRGQMLRDLVESNSDEGFAMGKKVTRALKNADQKRAFEAAFSQDELMNMRKVFDALKNSQGGRVSFDTSRGSLFLQSLPGMTAETGSILAALTFKGAQRALALTMAPAAASRFVTDPRVAKWILVGTSESATKQAVARATIQLGQLAVREFDAQVLSTPDFAADTRVGAPGMRGPSATLSGPASNR